MNEIFSNRTHVLVDRWPCLLKKKKKGCKLEKKLN